MKFALTLLLLTLMVLGRTRAGDTSNVKHVLFYSKASSWEQKIVHRDGNELSYLEKAVQQLGQENQIEFTFCKDGTVFTPENVSKYDAFFFFTSGDPTHENRTGRGDNYPLMTLAGKKAFLDAVRNGKGFVGCNTANYTFIEPESLGEKKDPTNSSRYTRMIGSGYMGHNEIQKGHFSYMDQKFPGMENLPADYAPVDQWYAFNKFMPDIHVIMALDTSKLTGNLYERPNYPVAWARMEGRGRVFYTTMGHTAAIWKDPAFLQMLLGGIRWAAGMVDAEVTPDIGKITPQAGEIPSRASKFIPSNPPLTNAHFPNFKVWLDKDYRTNAFKHVLVFSKSAGFEHPIAYRDTAWPSFLEKELLELGEENNVTFIFSKDGTIFTPENIAKYDAFLFYTTGDLVNQPRNGWGDNYPLMTTEGKNAFLQAIRSGKGFIGLHSAVATFPQGLNNLDDPPKTDPYHKMLGAEFIGDGIQQNGRLIQVDSKFPGMANIPADFSPFDEWHAMGNFASDLHVILALDCTKMTGKIYQRPNYPVAWARREDKGRVFFTAMGHNEEIWKNPTFQQMLLGGIRWASGELEADITPNLDKVVPQANEIPASARSVNSATRTK